MEINNNNQTYSFNLGSADQFNFKLYLDSNNINYFEEEIQANISPIIIYHIPVKYNKIISEYFAEENKVHPLKRNYVVIIGSLFLFLLYISVIIFFIYFLITEITNIFSNPYGISTKDIFVAIGFTLLFLFICIFPFLGLKNMILTFIFKDVLLYDEVKYKFSMEKYRIKIFNKKL